MNSKKAPKTLIPIVIENVTYTRFCDDAIDKTDPRMLSQCLGVIEERFNLDLTQYSHFEYAYSILKMQASWN